MTAKLLSKENGKAVYTLEIAHEDIEPFMNEAYKKLRGRFQIPGFRKGKAPRKIIEANYGKGIFFEEGLNDMLPQEIDKATKELGLEPVGQPDIDLKEMDEEKPIVLEVTTDLLPHPELGDLSTIQVVKRPVEVKDDQVEDVLKREQEKNAVLEPIEDRPVQDGDTVNIDYEGSIDGVPFEGGKDQGHDLEIGSGSFIPGFEDQIIGHEKGEEFDVNVTFPEEYHAEDLAGKEAVFHVVLNDIHEKQVPELDDDFAQDVSEYDTLEDYKASVRKDLEKRAEDAAKADHENQAIQGLVDISTFDLPDSMVDEQVEIEVRNMANQVGQMGITLDQYLQYTGMDLDGFRAQQRPMATLRLSGDLCLQALVDKIQPEVSEEELNEELKKIGEAYGAKDTDDFIKKVKELGNEKLVEEDVKKRKAIDHLMDQVQYVDEKDQKKEEEKKADPEENETKEEKSETESQE